MIRDVERIVVGGISGVKVRNLDYTAPTINNPGRLTATFVSETNTLLPPNLSYAASSFISIGSINLKMFPVAWRQVNSTSENQLEVTYEDGSFILDKLFVGLKTKHHEYVGKKNFLYNGRVRGFAEYNQNPTSPLGQLPSSFIMLGSFIDPCKDINKQTMTDPCSPCPEVVSDASKIDCTKLRSLSILDLDYNFTDLISGIRSKGLNVIVQADYNENYRTSYVGPLRSVLQSWCADYGFSYVYNSFGGAGQIIIYDLAAGININTKGLESSCSTISMQTEKSIQHTSANGIIAHYGVPGGTREISCGATFGKINPAPNYA
jgi:hypothetical protein